MMKSPRVILERLFINASLDILNSKNKGKGKKICKKRVDQALKELEEYYVNEKKPLENILNNPKKWMKWCDIKVLERCEELERKLASRKPDEVEQKQIKMRVNTLAQSIHNLMKGKK
jgi:hypothetical protein